MLAWAMDPGEEKGVHDQTAQCRESTRVECRYSCKSCHGEPWQPVDLRDLDKGDYELCTQCHKWEERNTPGAQGKMQDCMVRHHLENLEYSPDKTGAKLKEMPKGVKLFCGGGGAQCKVLCISCHFPMEKIGARMKIEQGFGSCMRCHA